MNLRYKFVFGRSTKMVLIPVSQEKIPSIKEEWQTTQLKQIFLRKNVLMYFFRNKTFSGIFLSFFQDEEAKNSGNFK